MRLCAKNFVILWDEAELTWTRDRKIQTYTREDQLEFWVFKLFNNAACKQHSI